MIKKFLILFLCLSMTSCSLKWKSEKEKRAVAEEKVVTEKVDSEKSLSEEAAPENKKENIYKIRRGDILEVVTWKEPDFSRELPVRIDGKISFPLLNDIQAEGRTTSEIRANIETGLKEFIKNPVVSLSVKSYGSQKFYILGEVTKTGEYDLVKNLTVLQAFALAGGFTEWASKKEIILIRREDDEDKIMRINYKDIIKGQGLEQNILIQSDDTIIVP